MGDKKKKPSEPPTTRKHAGRGGNNVSLYPMTPDEAVSRIARVKLADVKKLEAEEKAAKKG